MISFAFFAIVLFPFLLVLLFLLFLLHPLKVRIKPIVGPANQFAVKSFFAAAGFVAGDQQDRAALRVESERNTPPCASKRNSFIFAWRESFSVSTRGRLNCGPNCRNSMAKARISFCTSTCRA
jgi:hypothetical protein